MGVNQEIFLVKKEFHIFLKKYCKHQLHWEE